MIHHPEFFKGIKIFFKKKDYKALAQIWLLISEILKYKDEPLMGKGNPEYLKHLKAGTMSRRISKEHRLVYILSKDTLELKSCHGHYDD